MIPRLKDGGIGDFTPEAIPKNLYWLRFSNSWGGGGARLALNSTDVLKIT